MTTMAKLVAEHTANHGAVLDLGCAVGRASVELSRHFERVVGLDYSEAFIRTARDLLDQGSLRYQRHESGRHWTELLASVPDDVDRSRIQFVQGDASDLDSAGLGQPGQFDAVLLSNLLCRLPDPAACLKQFVGNHSPVAENGVLVLASPNSWLEQYTNPEDFLDAPDSESALEKLGKLLYEYELLHHQDLPFMIREHRRKYEYVVSQVSIWRRRPGPRS